MLKIAVCQLPIDIEDPGGNISLAKSAIHDAASKGAQLVVLPELTNSGSTFRDLSELDERATTLDGALIKQWVEYAKQLDIVLVGGLAIKEGGAFFNASVIIDSSGFRGWYKKVHLWNDEIDFFTPGESPPLVVETKFGRIATMVCYDVEFPEWVRLAMLDGAAILAVPTNWPDTGLPTNPVPLLATLIQAAAAQNKLIVAAADRTREERGVAWTASSLISGSNGTIHAIADRTRLHETQILIADVEVPTDRNLGPRNGVRSDRRPHLYSGILKK